MADTDFLFVNEKGYKSNWNRLCFRMVLIRKFKNFRMETRINS